ncbi:MAG: phenylacetate--CoA ligase family protein [Candidatus Marinimicrobia bacterium]|nr:phenylacetate--CoA ligase family protein [Candidatus Neomarinimicrobiota bacterium]
MKLYTPIARYLHFPLTQWIKGEKVAPYLRELEKSQFYTLKKIQEIQLARLKKLLLHAGENIPHYQNLFRNHSVYPESFTTLKDLEKIPCLTKEIILNGPKLLKTQNFHGRSYACTTSGSSGQPLNFSVTSDYSSWDWASRWRARRWFGVDIGDRELALWGRPVYNRFNRFFDPVKALFRNTLLLDGFNVSQENLEKYFHILVKCQPDYIYGYSNSVYQLALHIINEHENQKLPPLKAVFVTAEILYPNQRQTIENLFDAPVANEYGCSEIGGFAYECPAGNWHVSAENAIVESVSVNGNPAEFVLTSLTNFQMPFIRYRIGDLGELTDVHCDCGVKLPILKFNAGKTTDIIRLKTGRKLTSEIFLYLTRAMVEQNFQMPRKFRIFQKEPDRFLVQYEGDFENVSQVEFQRLFLNLLQTSEVIVDFQKVEKLTKDTTGKFRYFISEINHEIP